MQIEYIEQGSARFADPTQTQVDCFVKFTAFEDLIPFTATANDREAHGRDIWDRLQAGEAGAIASAPAPSESDLARDRDEAKARFASWADAVLRSQAGIVPDAERLSWGIKADVARAYQADPQSVSSEDLSILQAEADVTGETLDVLCPQIIAREAAYKPISGALAGFRRTIGAAIDAADTPEAIETALITGLANAEAALAAMQQ